MLMISDEKVSVIFCTLLHFVVHSQKKTKNNLEKLIKKRTTKLWYISESETNFINLKVAEATRIASALECIYIASLQISITGLHQS